MDYQKATFAGGCFWCMESPFEKIDGVVKVESGYSGGDQRNPTYTQVSSGRTGHLEAVQVTFEPQKVSYKELLDVFWRQIDPTDQGGQFADRGSQYATAIFYHDREQKKQAIISKNALQQSGVFDETIVTAILPFKRFYVAEEYHQDYYKRNPAQYKNYLQDSGRASFLKRIWGDTPQGPKAGTSSENAMDDEALKKRLTPLQYYVTKENGTEPPFDNQYWDNKREGIYIDVVSSEPLFSSLDKFESGTGWPSFSKSLETDNIIERKDLSHGMERIEVRSRGSNSHLGHLFEDGPPPTGMRYCINSAALRFIPVEKLAEMGYERYLSLFQKDPEASISTLH